MSELIHRFETLDSTNAKARELAGQGASEGTVVISARQTAGRGSKARAWHSPPGGLYLSTLLNPKSPERAPDLALVAGVAVVQAMRDLMPKGVAVSVKWPNDCLVDGKKVGGILCEALGDDYFHLCVVGIGLNVNATAEELAAFSTNPFPAASLRTAVGGEFPLEQVETMVLTKLFGLYHLYQQQGFAPIRFLWEKNCAFLGRQVELQGGFRGTFTGIDERGAIVLSNAQGERHTFHAGEITCSWL